MRWRASWPALIALVALAPGTVACSQDCGAVNCSVGVTVWWARGDVPGGETYRLCTTGRCEDVDPESAGAAHVVLHPSFGAADRRVRLEVLEGDGGQLASFVGAGRDHDGGCCTDVHLQAKDGRLVDRPVPGS